MEKNKFSTESIDDMMDFIRIHLAAEYTISASKVTYDKIINAHGEYPMRWRKTEYLAVATKED